MTPKGGSCALLLLSLSLGGCGKADSDLAERTPCAPLQNAELAASLAEPLGVGRSRVGTVYAISRVGSSHFVWRALDDQLIAYPVAQQNSALSATIFGVDAGGESFALTLRPETLQQPHSLRLFDELEDAIAPEGSQTTTGGTLLEPLPSEALNDFEIATRISPALVKAFRASIQSLGSTDLFVVHTSAGSDAPVAIFHGADAVVGEGGTLLQRRVSDSVRLPNDAGLEIHFSLDGEPASLQLDPTGSRGTLSVEHGVDVLGTGWASPRRLDQLEFYCNEPLSSDWAPASHGELSAAASCVQQELRFCLDAKGAMRQEIPIVDPRDPPLGPLTITELPTAVVAEVGSGILPRGSCQSFRMPAPGARENALWARLEHAGGEAWLTFAVAEPALPFRVGDTISLRSLEGPAARSSQELTVRSANGELLLWYGAAGTLSELGGIPEFEFTRGQNQCAVAGEFGRGSNQYALDSWHVGGEAARVGYGEALEQGPFRVHNGRIDRRVGALRADEGPGWSQLAVWRTIDD